MRTMRPPIFVAEGDDLGVFVTIDAAANAVEEVDVRGGAYVGYDADGTRLVLSWADGRCRVSPCEDAPTGVEELAALLRLHLGIEENESMPPELSLAGLVALAQLDVSKKRD